MESMKFYFSHSNTLPQVIEQSLFLFHAGLALGDLCPPGHAAGGADEQAGEANVRGGEGLIKLRPGKRKEYIYIPQKKPGKNQTLMLGHCLSPESYGCGSRGERRGGEEEQVSGSHAKFVLFKKNLFCLNVPYVWELQCTVELSGDLTRGMVVVERRDRHRLTEEERRTNLTIIEEINLEAFQAKMIRAFSSTP